MKTLEAAKAMKLSAKNLLDLRIIDEIISEPLGGAHRDQDSIAGDIKHSIIKNLRVFENLSKDEVYDQRKTKFLQIGRDQGFKKASSLNDVGLSYQETVVEKIKYHIIKNKLVYLGIALVLLAVLATLTN